MCTVVLQIVCLDFGYTVNRPVQSEHLDLCNSSYFSVHFNMTIKETEWLFDRLKLAELTGSLNCTTSAICPPTYVFLPTRTENGVKDLCATMTEAFGSTKDAETRTCWFLKENRQNFGLGTHCIPHPDPCIILPLLRPGKGYVIQPHIVHPALYLDDELATAENIAQRGRKYHLRLYILIAQTAAWARKPACVAAGARFYVHKHATKIVVSPNSWDAANTDPVVQITTSRGAINFAQWSGSESARTAMMEAVPPLIGAFLTKCVTPENDKMNFELVGADYMLDEAGHAWLLEVNTGPVLRETDPLDVALVRDIVNTVVLGDGSPTGGWQEVYAPSTIETDVVVAPRDA